MKHYEHLEEALCRELEKIDKKYAAGTEMTDVDLDRADKLYHALKSAATYHAMKDAEDDDGDYGRDRGRSYGRGRNMRTGRYMEGARPMEYIDPYWDRRY